jgi:hypothetical protein
VSTYCAEVLSQVPDRGARDESGRLPAVVRHELMFDVKVLLISERPTGFYLERFTESGEFVGDTQHDEMDDAMRHAYSEYAPISDWHLCPDDVRPLDYIRARSESGP